MPRLEAIFDLLRENQQEGGKKITLPHSLPLEKEKD